MPQEDAYTTMERGSRNPPWLFGILSIPYGVFNGLLVVLIPFLLRKHGVSPDRIANVIAISSIPNVWYFLWSPVVDTGLLRRTWFSSLPACRAFVDRLRLPRHRYHWRNSQFFC